MRVDASQSIYQEASDVDGDFSPAEARDCRILLRRLRFLEDRVRETGGIGSGNQGGVYAEMEMGALEWILTEVGFILEPVSRNT